MASFVYGDPDRIFLNTALGCDGGCRYCYLPALGITAGQMEASVDEILRLLDGTEAYRPGREGTILSLGCYSECWDENNREKTMELLRRLMRRENYIQLATKREIALPTLLELDSLAAFPGQLGIYLSVPTLSASREWEPGTDPVEARLSPLSCRHRLKNLYLVLYIKPVIPGVTLGDAVRYRRLMEKHGIPAVVGPMLEPGGGDAAVLVGESRLAERETEELDALTAYLAAGGRVYRHSTDVVRALKKRRREECSRN